MIEYYLPGLDASQLSDYALAVKLSHLLKIRKLEQDGDTSNLVNRILQNNQP